MSADRDVSLVNVGLQDLRQVWGWYLGLGIALIALGSLAIGNALTTTIAVMFLLGWLLLVGGLLEVAFSFWRKRWGGFFIELFTGLFYVVVGIIIMEKPEQAAEIITALLSVFLMFIGLFRVGVAVATRLPHWIWLAISGVVSLLLGILIWRNLTSSYWIIGCFVGIEMIVNGGQLVMLGLFAKKLASQRPLES